MSDIVDIIYESLNSGKMTKNTARNLLLMMETSSIDSELDSAINEMEIAESAFMESSLSYSNGEEEFSVFEKKAETFGDKVKKAWEAFKKWFNEIIKKIQKKISDIKAKITGKNNGVFSEFDLNKLAQMTKTLLSKLSVSDAIYAIVDTILAIRFTKAAVFFGKMVFQTEGIRCIATIKDNLLKINEKLTKLEMKADSNKLIAVIRPIISVCNNAILSVVYKETDIEKDRRNNAVKAQQLFIDANDKYTEKEKDIDKKAKLIDDTIAEYKKSVDYSEFEEYQDKLDDAIGKLKDPNDKTSLEHKAFVAYAKVLATKYKKAVDTYNKYNDYMKSEYEKINAMKKDLMKNSVESNRIYRETVNLGKTLVTDGGFVMRNIIASSYKLVRSSKLSPEDKAANVQPFINAADAFIQSYDITISVMNKGSANLSSSGKKAFESYKTKAETYKREIATLKEYIAHQKK